MSDNRTSTGGKFPNPDTQFKPGQSGNPKGRPVGTFDLSTRVRRLLEEPDQLPQPILETIKKVCGEDKRAIDAVMIAGLLQALQGDKGWAQFIVERGWGKMPDKIEGGDPAAPIHTRGELKITLVKAKESADE